MLGGMGTAHLPLLQQVWPGRSPEPRPSRAPPLPGPTYGLDDCLLEHALFVFLDDLGAEADGPVVAPGQNVVDTEPQLPQQSVEHLQHRGP